MHERKQNIVARKLVLKIVSKKATKRCLAKKVT
jgi:hypothetical protein